MADAIERDAAQALKSAQEADQRTASREAPAASGPAAKKAAVVGVNFGALQKELSTGSAIAKHIETSIAPTNGPALSKKIALLLQAISGRPTLVTQLVDNHPASVAMLLDKLCDSRVMGEPLDPYKAEFAIRLRDCGVLRSSFAKRVASAPVGSNVPLPLMSCKDMLTLLLERDVDALTERRIQIASSLGELATIATEVAVRLAPGEAGETAVVSDAVFTSTATALTHVFSKLRRVFKPENAADATPEVVDALVAATRTVFGMGTSTTGEQPRSRIGGGVPAKVTMGLSYLQKTVPDRMSSHEADCAAIKTRYETTTMAKLTQMEEVAKIKAACQSAEALDAVLDELSDETGSALRITSPDVLSALAVSARSLPEADEVAQLMKERVALLLQAFGVARLPRRAKEFVAATIRPKRPRAEATADEPEEADA